ncbi:MAG: AraC family transcriptional regulator [Akkermansiaceae bacterium]|nr:AraC family transcriptional regulator [Akkermansiaceae bacterium]
MEDLELVQASGLKPAVEALRRLGINADFYLERHGIPSDFIELPYAPVPKRERLWAFLDDVEGLEGLDNLGFLIGDNMDLTEVGPFGRMIAQASTLLDAVRVLQHNISNFAQRNSIGITHEGDTVWIFCESYKKTCRPADHLTLMFLVAVVRLAAGPNWRPSAVQLQTDPVEHLQSLPLLKDCSVEFNRPHAAVAVPAALLRQPLLNYDPDSPREHIHLTPLPDTGRLSDSLRVVVASLLPYHGPPGAEEAARMVGVSRSTLFRRLAGERTTYRDLVEGVRFEAARKCLRNPRLSVKDISFLLGYSNPNNFIRAFRNLAGIPPNEFRRERQVT